MKQTRQYLAFGHICHETYIIPKAKTTHLTSKACALLGVVVLLTASAPALAAGSDLTGAFSGVTDILKSVVRLLIFEWGYYIGIAALALQGYRWWAGHITMMDFLKWSVGIVFVFFAPSIVDSIRSSASTTI